MSDISLINLIIQRLEEERYTRQAEIRIISQHIQRLQQVRSTIAPQVRQRFSRTSTYSRYQEPNERGGHQGREERNAPNFSNNQENNQGQHIQEQTDARYVVATLTGPEETEIGLKTFANNKKETRD